MLAFQIENDNLIFHFDQYEGWKVLLHVCKNYLTPSVVKRLNDTLRWNCRTVVVEYEYVCKDYRDTYSNYYSKKYAKYPNETIRLLFFANIVPPDEIWNVASYSDCFIGYSVIRPTRINCLGRTILKPEFCTGVYGDICVNSYSVNFLGIDLTVEGFPFISQDSDVTCCAHASSWMCLRYFSESNSTVPEAFPFQISQVTKDLSLGRLIPSKGLTTGQISEILTHYGLYPEIYSRNKWGEEFERILYWYVESGIPVKYPFFNTQSWWRLGPTSFLHTA